MLYNHQYGFCPGHSTELASLELVDKVYQNLDKKKLPVAIYIDLSKAFDTLDHSILLDKLHFYGIRNNSLKWFQSYLSGRQQYVQIENTKSNMLQVTTGVLQGSILGPLLFLIYVNDMAQACNNFHGLLYADDTTLISPLENFQDDIVGTDHINTGVFSCNAGRLSDSNDILVANINKELESLTEWLSSNKLVLNASKTKFMLFHYPQRDVSHIKLNISFAGEIIEQVKEFNFLGLIISETMSWKPHIDKIASKVARTFGILNRLNICCHYIR